MSYASRTARRYARALFALAGEEAQRASVVEQLSLVQARCAELPELCTVLSHRRIAQARKRDLLDKVIASLDGAAHGDGPEGAPPVMGDLARDFLRLLVANGRVRLLGEVLDALTAMLDDQRNTMRAVVTTAVPLLKRERDMIGRKLAEHLGAARVELDEQVSEKVVAGVLIHVGDHVIDASVRTYLHTMRERLRQVRVSELAASGLLALKAEGQA